MISPSSPPAVPQIRVLLRKRPLLSSELFKTEVVQIEEDCKVLIEEGTGKIINSTFDFAFDESKGQKDVWKEVKEYFKEILNGGNLAILAYGQTGSGK
jgi:Microtubule binding